MPQRPYGNNFIVETPSLDRMEQRLYAEQKQKEAQQQYNIKQLDDEFSKNVSNIRDADVDDFTSLYNDYKSATQSSIKNKGGTSPQQQMELLRKRANMYKLINESKAEREREEMYGKRYSTKPDDFNDNAPELLIEGRKLPISKKRNYIGADGVAIDLTNPQNLLWQDKTNWQPILQKAGGTLNRRGESTKVKLPGGLEEEETTYKGLSSPVDYYQSIVGAAMSSPRGAKSLSNRYQFTPEEAQDITIKFEALKNTPEFKAAYGDVKFPEFADMTEGTRTAKLLAMTHALNNPIVAEKKKVKDLDAITKNRQQFAIEQQQRGHQNSLSRLFVYAGIRNQTPENIQNNVDGVINTHIESARGNNGQVVTDDETFETLTGKGKGRNSVLLIDEQGNYSYGKKDTETGKLVIEGTIPYELGKTKLTKKYKSGLDSRFNTGGEKPKVNKPSGTPKKKISW